MNSQLLKYTEDIKYLGFTVRSDLDDDKAIVAVPK